MEGGREGRSVGSPLFSQSIHHWGLAFLAASLFRDDVIRVLETRAPKSHRRYSLTILLLLLLPFLLLLFLLPVSKYGGNTSGATN